MPAAKHVYETFVRATPAEVWAAITDPEFIARHFHGARREGELRSDGPYRFVADDGSVAVEGEVEVFEPGRRLLLTWHTVFDTAMAEEPPGRVEWVLTPANDDETITRVRLRHLDLGLSPATSADVERSWVVVLDSMKSLLETGTGLGPITLDDEPSEPIDDHRRLAATANNSTWELLERIADDGGGLDDDETADLLERAWAAAYHWRRAAPPDGPQPHRAAWLVARAHLFVGDVRVGARMARRCGDLTRACPTAADFDQAYALEIAARAEAAQGHLEVAARLRAEAAQVPIADDQDREIVEIDLASGRWFGLD